MATISEDQRRCLMQCYGYNYSHLDRYGRVVSPRTCFLTGIPGPLRYMDFDKLKHYETFYMKHMHTKLNPNLINPGNLLFKTLFIEREATQVGKTSFVLKGYLRAPDNKTVLASSTMLNVLVDGSSGQKLTLPDWFMQKYGDLNEPVRFPEFPTVARNWFCKVKVHASDTDYNQHTNFDTYFTYAENAIYKFQKSLANIDFIKDYSLEDITVNYLGDSVQGDDLYIYVTPESSTDFFVIVEKDSQVILESKLKYCKVLSGSSSLWSKM